MSDPLDYPKAGDLPRQTLPGPGRQRDMELQPETSLANYKPAGKLAGKVAVVTGGDSGIGRAVAAAFAAEGADVAVLFNVNADDATDVKKQVEGYGRKCLLVQTDVSRRDNCFAAVGRVVGELVLVHG